MSQPETIVHTLRSRGSVLLGWAGAVPLVLLVLFSWDSSVLLRSVLLLVAALSWVLLVRPFVRIDVTGVTVGNPFRQVQLPWRLIEDTYHRWNLEIYAAGRTVSAWAISAHIERPKGVGMFGLGGLAKSPDRDAADRPTGAMTAYRAAQLVESVREEWLEAVREGELSEPADPRITTAWQPLEVAVVGLPLLGVLVGLLVR
ncbi:MAG TPA: PH domain-containing protein [Dermatophilaceae bacterium]|nr:PH domain-containing protein [Dermatophilaceae bacterium]